MEKVQEKIIKWNNILKNEYSFTDSAVNVTLENLGYEAAPLVKDVFKKVVHAINLIPTGVFTKSTAIDLVISSNNLGVITQNEEYVELQNQARSSVKSILTDNIAQIMKQIGETLKIECNIGGFYPGWEYAKESELREICIETFKNIYGHEPVVSAIHAGLECGLLLEKISGLDAISMGPDAYDVHSPNEHISIKSTENVYNLLLEILKRIK
jgi:dipeptidase D